MKQRNALVSNSSSASFICYWRCLNSIDDEPMNKTEAIKRLTSEFADKPEEYDDLTKSLIENTTETNSAGTYKTHGSTIMFNSVADVPSHLAYLIVGLKLESGYELIDFRVDRDG